MDASALSSVISELNLLKNTLETHTAAPTEERLKLSQAIDRLYLKLQTGSISMETANDGIQELTSMVRDLAETKPDALDLVLQNIPTSKRDQILLQNQQGLAHHFQNTPAPWDSRRMEILQGALANYIATAPTQLKNSALKIQKEISDVVWSNGAQNAKLMQQIEEDALSFKDELLAEIAKRTNNVHYSQNPEVENVLSNDFIKTIVDKANTTGLKQTSLLDESHQVRQLAAQRLQNQPRPQLRQELHETQELIQEASQALIAQETQKLNAMLKNVAKIVSPALKEADSLQLLHDIQNKAFVSLDHTPSSQHFHEIATASTNLLIHAIDIAQKNGHHAIDLQHLEELKNNIRHSCYIASSAAELSKESINPVLTESSWKANQEAQLEAQAMYAQQKMRFDTIPTRATYTQELPKANDAPSTLGLQSASSTLLKLHGLQNDAQHVAYFAPYAGSESIKNTPISLQIANNGLGISQKLPQQFDSTSKRINKVLDSVQNLANSPSLQSELGFHNTNLFETTDELAHNKHQHLHSVSQTLQELLPQLQFIATQAEQITNQFGKLNNDTFDSAILFCQEFSKVVSDNFIKLQNNIESNKNKSTRATTKKEYSKHSMSLNPNIEDPLHIDTTIQTNPLALSESIANKIQNIQNDITAKTNTIEENKAIAEQNTNSHNNIQSFDESIFKSPQGLGLLAKDMVAAHPGVFKNTQEALDFLTSNNPYAPTNSEDLKKRIARDRKPEPPKKQEKQEAIEHTVIHKAVLDVNDVLDDVTDMLADILHDEFERERLMNGE